MAIYFFTFLATPTPEAKEQEAGGAFVNCWIQSDDPDEAEERATDLIYDYGWTVDSLENEALVTGDDYVDDEENRAFYEQALAEKEVLVFHLWPRTGDEEPE
jgi:hypothetical protein